MPASVLGPLIFDERATERRAGLGNGSLRLGKSQVSSRAGLWVFAPSRSWSAPLPGVASTLVPAQGMVIGNLDQSDSNAVGVLDPHLDQPPWLQLGRLCDGHVGRRESTVLSGRITDLQPHRQPLRALLSLTRYLEQPVPQEEDDPRLLRWAEFAVYRQPEDVAVERLGPPRIRRSQQDTAAQNLHGAIVVSRTGRGGGPECAHSGTLEPATPGSSVRSGREPTGSR